MNRKFIWSTTALIIGVISFLGSIAQIANGNSQSNPLAGLFVILGALAYRSLKKRKLGILSTSKFRQFFELIALLVIILLVVLQNDLKTQITNDPVPNIVIPVWVLMAYAVLYFKTQEATNQNNLQNFNEDEQDHC